MVPKLIPRHWAEPDRARWHGECLSGVAVTRTTSRKNGPNKSTSRLLVSRGGGHGRQGGGQAWPHSYLREGLKLCQVQRPPGTCARARARTHSPSFSHYETTPQKPASAHSPNPGLPTLSSTHPWMLLVERPGQVGKELPPPHLRSLDLDAWCPQAPSQLPSCLFWNLRHV